MRIYFTLYIVIVAMVISIVTAIDTLTATSLTLKAGINSWGVLIASYENYFIEFGGQKVNFKVKLPMKLNTFTIRDNTCVFKHNIDSRIPETTTTHIVQLQADSTDLYSASYVGEVTIDPIITIFESFKLYCPINVGAVNAGEYPAEVIVTSTGSKFHSAGKMNIFDLRKFSKSAVITTPVYPFTGRPQFIMKLTNLQYGIRENSHIQLVGTASAFSIGAKVQYDIIGNNKVCSITRGGVVYENAVRVNPDREGSLLFSFHQSVPAGESISIECLDVFAIQSEGEFKVPHISVIVAEETQSLEFAPVSMIYSMNST